MADMVATTMVGGAMASWRPSPEETRRTANSKSCRGTGLAKSRLVPVPVDQECRGDEGRAAAAGSCQASTDMAVSASAITKHRKIAWKVICGNMPRHDSKQHRRILSLGKCPKTGPLIITSHSIHREGYGH